MPTLQTPSRPQRTAVEDLFRAVFERSLDFHIELNYDDAIAFIRCIGSYNDFEAETVIGALDQVDRMIPRRDYGSRNPNTGQRSYSISVGREGSPVIYLRRYEFSSTPALSETMRQAICGVMLGIGRADEATHEVHDLVGFHGHRIEFRFWWD